MLHKDNVVPTPEHAPFIHVGRDYYGPDLMVLPAYQELEAVLADRYQGRFKNPLERADPEFPSQYVFSLLEASIARSRGAWPIGKHALAISESVAELCAVLDSATYRMGCARQVSHLSTHDSAEVTIDGVLVVPERGGRHDLLQRLAKEIPLAPSAWNREPPFRYDPPHSLIIAREEQASGDPFEQGDLLSARIERFLLAVRLLTRGTIQSGFEARGHLGMVGRMSPTLIQHRGKVIGSLIRRTARLSTTDEPAIAAITALIAGAAVKREGMVSTPFDVALVKYNRSHDSGDLLEHVVDLTTALEATLTGDINSPELSLRLASRAALLLQTEEDSADKVFSDVQSLYGLRSTLVHGGPLKDNKLRRILRAITLVPEQFADQAPRIALAFAVDRLRDLVRRSILARLCLAAGPDPLWPWDSQETIELHLLKPSTAADWRSTWHMTLNEQGSAVAAGKATAAVDSFTPEDT